MAACDVLVNLRSPTMGETSGAVIRGALARQGDARLRRRLVLGAARRRRAEDPGRRVRGGDDRGRARARGRPRRRSSARRRARTSAREHDLDRVADAYARALEEAAGGDAVADAVLWRIAEAAAEVGLDDVSELARAGARGGARHVTVDRSTVRHASHRTAADAAERLVQSVTVSAPGHGAGQACGAWPRRGSAALAVPAWVWLAGIVVVSVAVRIALARRMVAPWIMIDEIVYSELAKSFAAHGEFLVRDVPSHGYGFVYPVLIAPAWRLFGAVPDAYAAAKAINAVVMSLAAVPAYFLARRLLRAAARARRRGADGAVPSMLYTGTLMTENAFYPLFLVVALALVATLERPTPLRQVVLLALCGLALRDARAGGRARRRRRDGAAPARALRAARLRRGAAAVRDALRDPRRRRAARAARDGRARPLAARAARRLPRRDDERLHRRRRPPLPRSTTSPSSTSTSACSRSRRCSRSGSRRAARRRRRAPSRPRRSRSSSGSLLEVAAFASQPSVQDRGAEPVLRRAARADRARRARRRRRRHAPPARARRPPRSSPACCRSSSRSRASSRRARSPTRFALLPWWWVQDHWIHLDQVRWAALAVALAAAALFFCCRAGTRSSCRRSSRAYFVADRVRGRERPPRDPPGVASASSGPGSTTRTRTGSTAPSAATPRSRSLDGRRDATRRSGRTSSSTAASGRSTRSTGAGAPTRCPRRRSTRRRRPRCVDADGTVVRAQYVLADGSTDVDGPRRRARPGVGLDALPRRRPARAA